MSRRRVLVTISHPPYDGSFCLEGLRTAVGLAAAPEGHELRILFLGDGAYFALRNLDRSQYLKMILALEERDIGMYVDKESLEDRRIPEESRAEDIRVVTTEEVLQMLNEADLNLRF